MLPEIGVSKLTAAAVPLLYSRSPYTEPIPALPVLIGNCLFDALIQKPIVFGEKPRLHMLVVSFNPGTGSSEVAVWRNIEEAEPTREALGRLERMLLKIKDRNPQKWFSIFHEYVLDKIVERVPLENAKTGQEITQL